MTPGMGPQWTLEPCHQRLVQRSSGDKLLGSDLHQELRLKAKSSFRSRGESPNQAAEIGDWKGINHYYIRPNTKFGFQLLTIQSFEANSSPETGSSVKKERDCVPSGQRQTPSDSRETPGA
ncbi:hypothetical protein TNCV_3484121 [Trichonephila clavipes]|nr:hypothetical protein TNCV_3484121 [Trichonephila clavipes]